MRAVGIPMALHLNDHLLSPTPMPASDLPRDPLEILPVEVWEKIFKSVAYPEFLLWHAQVCSTFNRLCILAFLERKGVLLEHLLNGKAPVSSGLIRALALYSVRQELPATKLVCHFSINSLQMAFTLNSLGYVIRRAPHLKDLSVNFGTDLFQMPQVISREEIKDLLQSVTTFLSQATQKIPGPVVVVPSNDTTVFTCTPAQIAKWKLHQFQFNPRSRWSWFNWRLNQQKTKPHTYWDAEQAPFTTQTRQPSGKYVQVAPLRKLSCFSLCFLPGSRPLSLLVFNVNELRQFSIRDEPALHLTLPILLSNIHLPALHTLAINTRFLDPKALRQFLVNHPSLTRLRFNPWIQQQQQPTAHDWQPLFDPPLAHPGLEELFTTIQSESKTVLAPLAMSPSLYWISLSVDASPSQNTLQTFLEELKSLANPSPPQRNLWVHISFQEREPRPGQGHSKALSWTQSPRMLQAAANIHCTKHLSISVYSQEGGENILPWVALWAVEKVTLDLWTGGGRELSTENAHKASQEFLAVARPQLPNIPEVSCYVY
uniref:F-box domain-containing protein n=1 Tax=Mycena chlorophos TaxID=658473 RepID=A0ABQ0LN77_MYCCL|nr:predicted protein [Mycena chlorophos]